MRMDKKPWLSKGRSEDVAVKDEERALRGKIKLVERWQQQEMESSEDINIIQGSRSHKSEFCSTFK